jgi:hypothetical protein
LVKNSKGMPLMKKLILFLGLVVILVQGIGFGTKVQAGIIGREEVLFMEIPQAVPFSKITEPVGKITKGSSQEPSLDEPGGKR